MVYFEGWEYCTTAGKRVKEDVRVLPSNLRDPYKSKDPVKPGLLFHSVLVLYDHLKGKRGL